MRKLELVLLEPEMSLPIMLRGLTPARELGQLACMILLPGQLNKRLSEERKLICMPGHNNIYLPRMEEIKRAIDDGDLGKLSYLSILYNIHHPEKVARKYPGVIRQVMTHHVYTLLYLGGQPKNVQALKAVQHYEEFTEEDIAVANLVMESGALAHLEVNFAGDDHSADPWSLYVKVIGIQGTERFSYNDSVSEGRTITL